MFSPAPNGLMGSVKSRGFILLIKKVMIPSHFLCHPQQAVNLGQAPERRFCSNYAKSTLSLEPMYRCLIEIE